MRTFAQKPKATQQAASAKSTISGRAHFGQSREVNSILHMQRTIGNQAVQRMLQTNAEELKAGLIGTPLPHFGRDLSRIPMHTPTAGTIQAKLAIHEPGDEYEQEADRVAERVMRMPEPQLQRACPGGGGCPRCQANQPSHAHEHLQTTRVQARDTGQIAAPPSVHEVLAAPGQPLDPTTQGFLERRFGHDLSKVRVHSGAAAERSARDVSAHAYTVGHNIVFGASRFEPGTHEGRRLLAHELTHVLQQSRSAGNLPSLQRNGPKPGSTAAKLETAKNDLKAKYGLKDISEQGGVSWTESQLKRIDAALSRMSPEERKRLQGVTLVLTDKFPSKKLRGKTFTIAGTTYGTHRVELTPVGTKKTVLHEAGHLIHNTAIANAEKIFERSQFKADREAARGVLNESSKQRFRVSADHRHIGDQFNAVVEAAEAFEQSGDADRASKRAALEQAEMNLPFLGSDPDAQALSAHADKLRAFVAALLLWSDERENAVGPVKRLDEFVSMVKKHGLARRSFPAFTSYAEANWPDKPSEFFAEAYDSWRNNPADMKKKGRALFDWFEKGGHLGPTVPPPRQRINIPIPKKIPGLHEHAPVFEELLLEAGETFLPLIEESVNLIP
jgi:Domain of unknown function (DUF4157)